MIPEEQKESISQEDYEATWATIEQTAKEEDPAAFEDIFAQFADDYEIAPEGDSEPAPEAPESGSPEIRVGEDPIHPGKFAIFANGQIVEQFFPTREDAEAMLGDWEEFYSESSNAGNPYTLTPVSSVEPEKNLDYYFALIPDAHNLKRKIDSSLPLTARVAVIQDPYHVDEWAITLDGEIVEQHFPTLVFAEQRYLEWEQYARENPASDPDELLDPEPVQKKPKAMCAICGVVSVNKNSPILNGEKVCKKCSIDSQSVAQESETSQEIPESTEPNGEGFIAYAEEADVIWGLGDSISAAEEDARQSWKEFYNRLPEDHEIKTVRASACLCDMVRTWGGELSNQGDWTITNGKANFVEVDEEVLKIRRAPFIAFENEGEFIFANGPTEQIAIYEAKKYIEAEDYLVTGEIRAAKISEALYDDWIEDRPLQWRLDSEGVARRIDEPQMQIQPCSATCPQDCTNHQQMQIQEQTPAETVKTEAGLIDPDTGEVIDPSLIYRKFGWTELPVLSKLPSKEEIAEFKGKLDQVADLMLTYSEKVERWTAANELRCKPLVKAIEFYQTQFIEPMSRMVGPYGLPTYQSGKKKGQYSAKSMVLPSGVISFIASGGAFVHDSALVKKHIEEKGIGMFEAIGAERVIKYDHNKLISALNNGTLQSKDIPGTGVKPKNEFAKVSVASPKRTASQVEEQANGED